MSLILSLDTATENAFVSVARNGEIISQMQNDEQKNHAAFVQPAVLRLLQSSGIQLQELDAIAVTQGHGSYTGLRVGLASAKGLCYSLQKPLLLINTLELMAFGIISSGKYRLTDTLYCPMIDARRMEVFTAVYDARLHPVLLPESKILDQHSFSDLLAQHPVVFSGSGYKKLETLLDHPNAFFTDMRYQPVHMAYLANDAFQRKLFADSAYSEPLYLKEFFTPSH